MCYLMDEWVVILKETALGNFEEPWDALALHLDLPRLEAVALASMCCIEADVRRAAMDVLAAVRRLHQALIVVAQSAPARSSSGAIIMLNTFQEPPCQWVLFSLMPTCCSQAAAPKLSPLLRKALLHNPFQLDPLRSFCYQVDQNICSWCTLVEASRSVSGGCLRWLTNPGDIWHDAPRTGSLSCTVHGTDVP